MADPDRIVARLQALWEIAQGPGGGADRPAYSPAEAHAMTLVAGWAGELGLAPAIDPHGNLWALPGDDDGQGPVVTAGSHVDTVPDGGRYDGALGTVLGLELVADLAAAGETRAGLLVCAAEEAPRFGAGTVGSRLLTGSLTETALDGLHDAAGITAREARDSYLAALAELPRVAEPPTGRVRAHVEVHVALRFGPPQLGIVTRVASPRRLEVAIAGEPGHAGEVSMDERRDALAAAAEIVLAVERAALDEPAETVATVGTLTVTPGAVSVIPGGARLGIDMRAIEDDSLNRLQHAVETAVSEVAEDRGVRATTTLVRAGSPVAMNPELAADALRIARERGVAAITTWSGAGHDAQHVNGFAPALLVFVPLHGGQSHTPQEGALMSEILHAVEVATATVGDTIRQM